MYVCTCVTVHRHTYIYSDKCSVFTLRSNPKPVFVKEHVATDEEEGLTEAKIGKFHWVQRSAVGCNPLYISCCIACKGSSCVSNVSLVMVILVHYTYMYVRTHYLTYSHVLTLCTYTVLL